MKAPKRDQNKPPVDLSLGFVEHFTLAFVILKLTGYIKWSWWWVISPVWITYGSLILLAIILAAIPDPQEKRREKEREELLKMLAGRMEARSNERNTTDTIHTVRHTDNITDGGMDHEVDNV